MPSEHDRLTGTDSETTERSPGRLARRRVLQLVGAGAIGGAVGLGQAGAASTALPNEIVFDGSGSGAEADYEFGVSGSVEPDGDVGAVEREDSVDGSTVVGVVQQDTDAYAFGGDLTHLDVSGEVSVSISYATVDRSGPDRLEIVTPADGSVEYTFETDGQVAKVTDAGRNSSEGNDSISANDDGSWTVEGLTGNGYGDTYDLHGAVTAFEPTDGDFTLFLNGDQVTVADLAGGQSPGDGSGGGSNDGSDDDGDDSDGDSDGSDDVRTHTVEIVTPPDGSVEYALSTSGPIAKVTDAGRNSSEGNDTITENGDGTYTVTGLTGNGYGDTLEYEGEALDFEPLEGRFTLYLDGQEVTPRELVDDDHTTRRFEIVTPADGSVEYTFETTGAVSKVTDAGRNSSEGNDTIAANGDGTYTVTGLTGNGYGDAFDVDGDVTAFDPREGTFALYLDGQQVTASELGGEAPPDDGAGDGDSGDSGSSGGGGSADGGPIGGGRGYGRVVGRDRADYVVRTADELAGALSAAGSGEVVYVAGDATIDLGNRSYAVPAGVTLASNRGIDDAPGGLLRTDYEEYQLFDVYADARVTGIRLRGANPGTSQGDSVASGLVAQADGVEVDNCEVTGFVEAAVWSWNGEAHVHHNYIHHNNRDGFGYGVANDAGHPVIEYNYFNYNRHSVESSGDHHGYTCRYNHFGPTEVKHNIDMHEPAGVNYQVHNNVVETLEREADGQMNINVAVRGAPDDSCDVFDNWFFNPNRPDPNGDPHVYGRAITQSGVSEWTNVSFMDSDGTHANHYGEDASVTYGDVIPGYDGGRSP